MKLRSLIVAGTASAALLVPSTSAMALDQTVTGVAADQIALSVPVAAVFGSVFTPGATVNSTLGAVTAVSTNPNWTLSAAETGGDGKMARSIATGACATSAPVLTNAASVAVTPVIANGSITSTTRTLSGSDQVVASASAVPLAATVFNTTYSQVLPSNELLSSGCTYTMTTTYTLAAGA
jgi:hypothetical protein